MINWTLPSFEILEKIEQVSFANNYFGCDITPSNIFLYKDKYNTKVSFHKNFFLRRYTENNQVYYGEPLFVDSNVADKDEQLDDIVNELREDALKLNQKLQIFFISDINVAFYKKMASNNSNITFSENRDLADYVYASSSLKNLEGSKYHSKRNHIKKFQKKYEDIKVSSLNKDNIDDALQIEEQWLSKTDLSEEFLTERQIIITALNNLENLNMKGLLLYVDEQPVAFSIFSRINNLAADINFEKAIYPYSNDGAYAYINKIEAENLSDYKFINREEDLGIEGLRKAKLSYYPEILLAKNIFVES